MCLITTQKEPFIATEPIVVYKVLKVILLTKNYANDGLDLMIAYGKDCSGLYLGYYNDGCI